MHPALVALVIIVSVLVGAKLNPEQSAFYAGVGATVFLMLAAWGWIDDNSP